MLCVTTSSVCDDVSCAMCSLYVVLTADKTWAVEEGPWAVLNPYSLGQSCDLPLMTNSLINSSHHVIAVVARSAARVALPDILAPPALLALPARLHLQATSLPRPQERPPLEVSQFEVHWICDPDNWY